MMAPYDYDKILEVNENDGPAVSKIAAHIQKMLAMARKIMQYRISRFAHGINLFVLAAN